jgi:16S rRNA (guanine527-N7)-methyltransferase
MFEVYKSVLQDWNETRFNLTAVTGDRDIALKHFIDSLEVYKVINLKGKKLNVIDIGTGAGFPGVPIKIAFPHLKMTLVDSQRKRTLFLAVLLRRLAFSDVAVFNARGEELAKDEDFREKFDIVLMRELNKLPVNIEIGLPFLKQRGFLVLWKGKSDIEEVGNFEQFVNRLGGRIEKIKKYRLDSVRERYLIVIKKINPTPVKYPRSFSSMMRSLREGV